MTGNDRETKWFPYKFTPPRHHNLNKPTGAIPKKTTAFEKECPIDSLCTEPLELSSESDDLLGITDDTSEKSFTIINNPSNKINESKQKTGIPYTERKSYTNKYVGYTNKNPLSFDTGIVQPDTLYTANTTSSKKQPKTAQEYPRTNNNNNYNHRHQNNMEKKVLDLITSNLKERRKVRETQDENTRRHKLNYPNLYCKEKECIIRRDMLYPEQHYCLTHRNHENTPRKRQQNYKLNMAHRCDNNRFPWNNQPMDPTELRRRPQRKEPRTRHVIIKHDEQNTNYNRKRPTPIVNKRQRKPQTGIKNQKEHQPNDTYDQLRAIARTINENKFDLIKQTLQTIINRYSIHLLLLYIISCIPGTTAMDDTEDHKNDVGETTGNSVETLTITNTVINTLAEISHYSPEISYFLTLFFVVRTLPQSIKTQMIGMHYLMYYLTNNTANASMLTAMKRGFVFEHVGTIHLKPHVVHTNLNYYPCDIILLIEELEKTTTAHANLCKTDINSDLANNDLVKTYNEQYILLSTEYSYPEAELACKKLGTFIADVRPEFGDNGHNMSKFMTNNKIATTWAGLTFDEKVMLPIYASDKTPKRLNDTNGPLDYRSAPQGGPKQRITWRWVGKNHMNPSHYGKEGAKFAYMLGTNDVDLTIIYRQRNNLRYPLLRLQTICKGLPKWQDREEHIENWKIQCKSTQKHLQRTLQNAKYQAQKLDPAKLYRNKEQLTTFIKREANTNQNNYQEQLTANNNRLNCSRIMTTYNNHNQGQQTSINVNNYYNRMMNSYNNLNNKNAATKTINRNTNIEIEKRSIPVFILTIGQMILNVGLTAYTAATFIKDGIIAAKWIQDKMAPTLNEPSPDTYTNDIMIAQLLKQEEFQYLLQQSMRFTVATTCEIKLTDKIRTIASYIDEVYNTIDSMLLSQKEPEPRTFLTDAMFNSINDEIYNKFSVTPPQTIKNLKAKLTVTNNSFVATISIPLEIDDTLCDVYRIIPSPKYKKGKYYLPEIRESLFAANTKKSEFTSLTQNEFDVCKANAFCSSSKPTFTSTMAPCGISSFYGMPDNCIYKQTEEQSFFHSTGGKTYYSIPKGKTESFQASCLHSNRRGVESNEQVEISNRGVFSLKVGCILTDTKTILRPNYRFLNDPITIQGTAMENFPDNDSEEEQDDDMYTATDDIQNLLEIHQIILYVMSGLAVAIPVAVLWTCKRCANTKLQVCCSPFTEEDLQKLDAHVEQRPERREKRAQKKAAKALQQSGATATTINETDQYEMKIKHKNTAARHKKVHTMEEPQTRELTPLMKSKTEKQTSIQAKCHLCSDILPPGLVKSHYENEHNVHENATSFNPTYT